ncbi:MAG: NUDIX domain-containing protein [Gemmatimonadales bacterium]
MARRLVRQAGGIVTRGARGSVHVLLVTTRRKPRQWVIPKGNIDPGERPSEAALREVREEAGVKGQLLEHLGQFSYRYGKRRIVVRSYLVRALNKAKDREGRTHCWCTFNEALEKLSFAQARALLRRNRSRILASGSYRRPSK